MSPCGRAQPLRTHQTHSVPVCGRDRLDLRQGHKEHERQNRTLMQTRASTHRQSRRSRYSSCQPRRRGQLFLTRTHPRTPKRSRAPPGLAARPQARASQDPKPMPLPCLMNHQDDSYIFFQIVRYSRNSRNWYCLNTVVRVVLKVCTGGKPHFRILYGNTITLCLVVTERCFLNNHQGCKKRSPGTVEGVAASTKFGGMDRFEEMRTGSFWAHFS